MLQNRKRQHVRRLPNGALEQLGGVRSAFEGVRRRRGGGELVAGADLVGPAAGEDASTAGLQCFGVSIPPFRQSNASRLEQRLLRYVLGLSKHLERG